MRSACFKTLFLSFFLLLPLPVLAQGSVPEARAYVVQLGDKTIAIIADTKMSEQQKDAKLTTLFTETIDTDWIGRFVLGRYWRTASDAQQKQYLTIYRQFLINSYVPNFRQYTGEKFKVNIVNQEGMDFIVKTEIIHPDKPSTRVDYRIIRASNGLYKVHDIVAEGVSLLETERSDFGSVLSREGMDSLIKMLQAKVSNPSS